MVFEQDDHGPRNPIGFDRPPATKIQVVKAVPEAELRAYAQAIKDRLGL
jgi:hypothetical protein